MLPSNPATHFYYGSETASLANTFGVREQGVWNLIQEGAWSGAATRIYAHGNRVDEVVADYSYTDSQFRYHHYDARGHCILLTDSTGNLIEQYDYDAFGHPYFYNANTPGGVRSAFSDELPNKLGTFGR